MGALPDFAAGTASRQGDSRWSMIISRVAGGETLPGGRGLATFLLGAVASVFSVFPPGTRAVVIDEWAYLKAARELGRVAAFRPDPTTVAPDLIPVSLSAAIGRVFGGELWSLRAVSAVSFVVMGIVAYLLALELGVGRGRAIVCGIASVVNPIVLPLAVTGMSDLPGAALLWAACLLGAKYMKRPSAGTLIGCCGLSVAAASTRPPGAIPVVVLTALAILGSRSRRAYLWGVAAGTATSVALAIGALVFAEATASTLHYLKDAASAPAGVWMKMTLLYPVQAILYLALVAVPISVGLAVSEWRRRKLVEVVTAGGGVGLAGALLTGPGVLRFPYMSWGSVVASNGIGGGDRPQLPSIFLVAISVLVAMSLGLLAMALVGERRDPGYPETRRALRAGVAALKQPGPGAFVASVAAVLLLIGALMGFAFDDGRTGYDRYLIPVFAPGLALLCSRMGAKRISRPAFAIATVAVVAVVVVGVQDWYAHRRATWSELEALTAAGVRPTKIDGGFEWSAHNQPPYYTPRFDVSGSIPWYIREFAPSIDREYILSASIAEDYEVVKTVRWKSWVREGTLYLQRRPPATRAAPPTGV